MSPSERLASRHKAMFFWEHEADNSAAGFKSEKKKIQASSHQRRQHPIVCPRLLAILRSLDLD